MSSHIARIESAIRAHILDNEEDFLGSVGGVSELSRRTEEFRDGVRELRRSFARVRASFIVIRPVKTNKQTNTIAIPCAPVCVCACSNRPPQCVHRYQLMCTRLYIQLICRRAGSPGYVWLTGFKIALLKAVIL